MSRQFVLESIQDSAVANWMRYTSAAMPIVEALHVLAAVLVFGTVLIVDLRLLGALDSSRPYSRMSRETLPLTWLAFGVALVTGSLMFTTSGELQIEAQGSIFSDAIMPPSSVKLYRRSTGLPGKSPVTRFVTM